LHAASESQLHSHASLMPNTLPLFGVAHAQQRTESDEVTLSHAVSRGVEPPPAGRVRFADDARPTKAPRTVSSSWRCATASSAIRPLTITLDSGCTFQLPHASSPRGPYECSSLLRRDHRIDRENLLQMDRRRTHHCYGQIRTVTALLVRDVRIADGAADTLLSVHQLCGHSNTGTAASASTTRYTSPRQTMSTRSRSAARRACTTGTWCWAALAGLPAMSLNTQPASKPVAAFIVLTRHLKYTISAFPTLQL
jgi:hypothetical protein